MQIGIIGKLMTKFQFQIHLQFYSTVDKVETCDGNDQKFRKVAPSFQPFHFGYYFVFSSLRFNYIEYKGTLTYSQ